MLETQRVFNILMRFSSFGTFLLFTGPPFLLTNHLELVIHRANIAQGGMSSDGVVMDFNEFEYFSSGIFENFKGSAFQQLCFKSGEMVFHKSVILGVAALLML